MLDGAVDLLRVTATDILVYLKIKKRSLI